MEKLIELLNEYDNEEFWEALYMENKVYANDFLIISKKYWFIQWLVKKDKIDGLKFFENEYTPTWINAKWEIDSYSVYDQILMMLAIQDNPIEFLVSILK